VAAKNNLVCALDVNILAITIYRSVCYALLLCKEYYMALSDAQGEIFRCALPEAEAANASMQALASALREKAGHLHSAILLMDNSVKDKLAVTKTSCIEVGKKRTTGLEHTNNATQAIANTIEDENHPARQLADVYLDNNRTVLASTVGPTESASTTLEEIWSNLQML
jgi:hypothetical protein